jgi:hypothetical protein
MSHLDWLAKKGGKIQRSCPGTSRPNTGPDRAGPDRAGRPLAGRPLAGPFPLKLG